MFENFGKIKRGFLLFLLVWSVAFCWADQQLDKTGANPAKYISIDEIRPGMEAYCLTAYKGTEVEKFDLDVIGVVRNIEPGRNWILVQGTDERFTYTGPAGGCSGSPVYIDGRLAGALAFAPGWPFSKDPLYGVTPIEEMHRAGTSRGLGHEEQNTSCEAGFVFDFSRPIDFAEIDRQMREYMGIRAQAYKTASNWQSLAPLPCPLMTCGLPSGVCEQLNALVEPFALFAIPGVGGGVDVSEDKDVQLAPGAVLAVPLVTGDITMAVIGTVTEVADEKIYGFGHGFLGYGSIDLPMATGQVHTVVSSLRRSFKLVSVLEIVGALTTDESTAVVGQVGAKARMIPLTITVNRYNDTERRVYNCQTVDNRLLTPTILRSAVAGAALMFGDLPPDHTIAYEVSIGVKGAEPITFENVSTGLGLAEMVTESIGSVTLLLNNPYKKVDIKSINIDISIAARDISSRIWSVDLSDSRIKAGEQIEVAVTVESFLAEKKKYQIDLRVPSDVPPGRYNLVVSGPDGYQEFLTKATPYKFVPQNLPSLLEAMNSLLAIRRDRLYCLLVLPPGGVAVEGAELPDLPATKALVLTDVKRALRTQPYQHWIERSLDTGTVIVDKKVMHITVEK